jgi:hypothetical protein
MAQKWLWPYRKNRQNLEWVADFNGQKWGILHDVGFSGDHLYYPGIVYSDGRFHKESGLFRKRSEAIAFIKKQRGTKRNPAVKLPSKFTPAEVRVNEQGKVQIRINPAKLGSGGRFAKCVESVTAKGGAVDPRAVCAAAGRKKYGAKKFATMAQAGRKRARHNPEMPRYWTVRIPATAYQNAHSILVLAKSKTEASRKARRELRVSRLPGKTRITRARSV